MHRLLIPAAAVLLAASSPSQSQRAPSPRDIVATAKAAGQFETLLAAAGAADLAGALTGKGPFTVFAPTDDAFAKLGKDTLSDLLRPENKARLAAILKLHVVAGRVDAVTALRLGTAETLNGQPVQIRLEDGRLRVGAANVVQNDIAASNGIIHVIDTVLLPDVGAAITIENTPRAAARQLLETAVEFGAPRFNGGDAETCVEIYQLALVAVLGLGRDLIDDASRATAEQARTDAAGQRDPKEAAWRLRRGIDVVYRALDDAPTRVGDAGRLRARGSASR